MSTSTIGIYGRISEGERYLGDLTRHVPDWQDTSRAVGGCWTGQGTIAGTLNRLALTELFNRSLGRTIRRTAFGQVAWEGLIYELRLRSAGIEYVRSLAPERFANAVQVRNTDEQGRKRSSAWAENAESRAQYGTAQYIITAGQVAAFAVEKLRDRRLAEFGWPRTYMTSAGGFAAPGRQAHNADQLQIMAAGYWSTLNWTYYGTPAGDEVDQPKECSLRVAQAIAQSQFVTAGRIETNADMFTLTADDPPQRVGDVIEGIIAEGGYDGKPWLGGVWPGRTFVYEAAPTAVRYLWRAGQLCLLSGIPATLAVVRPGFLLRNMDTPPRSLPAGSSDVWNDPRVAYVDEVTWQAPGLLALGVLEPNVGPSEAQLARNERIANAEQARIQEAQAALARDWDRDYARREREYVENSRWADYERLTGHPWSGRYDA